MHVPNINMSSKYKHIMTHSPFSYLDYTHLSTSLGGKPSQSKTLSSFSCHYFSDCFNPYKDFKSLHTIFSWLGTTHPSGWVI